MGGNKLVGKDLSDLTPEGLAFKKIVSIRHLRVPDRAGYLPDSIVPAGYG